MPVPMPFPLPLRSCPARVDPESGAALPNTSTYRARTCDADEDRDKGLGGGAFETDDPPRSLVGSASPVSPVPTPPARASRADTKEDAGGAPIGGPVGGGGSPEPSSDDPTSEPAVPLFSFLSTHDLSFSS